MDGMSLSDESSFARTPPRTDVPKASVPPTRHAFPVAHHLPLERQTPVTTGRPGWWLVDELVVTNGPYENKGDTWYDVIPHTEWGSSLSRQLSTPENRTDSQQRVLAMPRRSSDLWVYLDDEQSRTVEDLAPLDPMAWYHRAMETTSEPPPTQSPRPARELPSLTGRRMRVHTPTAGWSWCMGLSEPIADAGGFTVTVCPPSDYWRAAYGFVPEGRTWLRRYPLHALWTY